MDKKIENIIIELTDKLGNNLLKASADFLSSEIVIGKTAPQIATSIVSAYNIAMLTSLNSFCEITGMGMEKWFEMFEKRHKKMIAEIRKEQMEGRM